MADNPSTLGVVIVGYRSQDVILECLETLFQSKDVVLKVIVVDNASPDETCQRITDWASGARAFETPVRSPVQGGDAVAKPIATQFVAEDSMPATLGPLTVVRSPVNRGFAGAVNIGLAALKDQVDLYWVLNPDCVTPPGTAAAYAARAKANPGFGLMTGQTLYYDRPDRLQTAGGWVDRRTGVCRQRSGDALATSLDVSNDATLEWVTGANLVASPAFLAQAGLMTEDYFLYYEEVDWAFRRGALPIVFAPDAVVFHHGGTVIGTGSIDRRPSPFANYFNHRNRIRFARRFLGRLPVAAYAYGLAKAAQLLLKGAGAEAQAVVAGMFEWPPSKGVRSRIDDDAAAKLAFGRP